MDKELENRPDIISDDAGIDHEPENIAADEVSEQPAEIVFTSDFTVSDVIKHALQGPEA